MDKIYAVEGEFHEVVPNIRLLIECEVIAGFYMDLFNFYVKKKNNLTKRQINEDLIPKDYNFNENIENKLLNLKGKILNDNVPFKGSDEEKNMGKNENLQSEIITLYDNLNRDFKNNKFGNYVFQNLHLTFEENKTTAIFGPSGCGKSTLLKLIIRLYDLDTNNGQILVDDILNLHYLKYDISNQIKLTLKNYRNNIGYVEQRPILLNDTIRNNILVGRSYISDEIIWEKLKLLKLDKYIKSLDKQLDYIVGEKGNKLSGRQKLRIAIARALVEDPNILIFDEATSSLDEENFIRINNIINSLKGSKTIIIATHDLRLLNNIDKIIILNDKGTILEQGTPEELIKKNGEYLKELKERFLENEKMVIQEMDENIDYINDVITIKDIQKSKNENALKGFIYSLFQNKLFFSLSIFLCYVVVY